MAVGRPPTVDEILGAGRQININDVAQAYGVAAREQVPAQQAQMRGAIILRLVAWAWARSVIDSPATATVRNGLAFTDYGIVNDEWLTPAQVAPGAGAGTFTNYIANAVLPVQRVAAFWAAANLTANPFINILRFNSGGAMRLTYLDMERFEAEMESTVFFPEAIYFLGNETIQADTRARVGGAGVTERLVLVSMVVDRRGLIASGNVV